MGRARSNHFEKRQIFMEKFKPVSYRNVQIHFWKTGRYDCRYKSQLEGESFALLLQNSFEKDRILQRTTVGIHKDDLDLPLIIIL